MGSKLRRLGYPLFGLVVLGGYGFFHATGRDPFASGGERYQAPDDVRRAPSRAAPVFWYGRGFHGGK